ncbi:MAG: YcxB family protein [Methylocystis sp.]
MGAVTYTLNPNLLAKGHKWVWTKVFWLPLMKLAMILAFGLFTISSWEHRGLVLAVSAAVFVIVWGVWIAMLPNHAQRRFNRLSSLQIPYTMTWREGELKWVSAESRHTYDLGELLRWSDREDCILLLTADNMLWMIPKSSFSTPLDLADLRAFLVGIRAPS